MGWLSSLFEDYSDFSSTCYDDFSINPASGLPMLDGIGSIDVAGNPYGTDSSHTFDSSFGCSCGSDFDSGFGSSGCGGGFDSDW